MRWLKYCPRKSESSRWIERGEEVIVLNPEKRVYHKLNRTAAWVWQLCDGSREISGISELVKAHFNTKGISPISDVLAVVRCLKKSGLVELYRNKCLAAQERVRKGNE